jgi:5-dehydro-2-deoxygluconokinase
MLIDGTHGREALFRAADHPFWIGRPVEQSGSRPLDFDGMDSLGAHLAEWPVVHTVKVLALYHPDDPAGLRARQDRELRRVFDACRTLGRELLVEIIVSKHGPVGEDTAARALEAVYAAGVKPDWWKLEPQASAAAWEAVSGVIGRHDPHCRGIVMLGLDAAQDALEAAFRVAAACPRVKGFAVGRTIFADAARAWLDGRLTDAAAIDDMAGRFAALDTSWRNACAAVNRRTP